jgi:hypothetical protein
VGVICGRLGLESKLTTLVTVRRLGFNGEPRTKESHSWLNLSNHPGCSCEGSTEKALWLMIILSKDKLFEFKMNYALK